MAGNERATLLRILHTTHCLREDGLPGARVDFEWLLSLSHEDARKHIWNRTNHLVQGLRVLDQDHRDGVFNLHTGKHRKKVDDYAQQILDVYFEKAGDASEAQKSTVRTLVSAAAGLHDIGNNLNRHRHADSGVSLVARMVFDNYRSDDPRFMALLGAIYLHDESNGVNITPDYFARLESPFREVILSLIAADKIDIGRHRLSPRFLDEEYRSEHDIFKILLENPHNVISAFAENTHFDLTEKEATITIDFSNRLDNSGDTLVNHIIKNFKWKEEREEIKVPQRWYKEFKYGSNLYVDSYKGLLFHTYSERFALMSAALFALFPKLEALTIQVHDKHTGGFSGQRLTRDIWDRELFRYWKNKVEIKHADIEAGRAEVLPIFKKGYEQWKKERVPNEE